MNSRAFIIIIVAFVVIVVATFFLVQSMPKEPAPDEPEVTQQEEQDPTTPEDAIRQAENFRPTGSCAQVITPAVHEATGARYTFSSSCLPDGWVRDQSGVEQLEE